MTRRGTYTRAVVHLAAALYGAWWGVLIDFMRLNGAPFTWWSRVLIAGAIVLAAGGVLTWTPARRWAALVALVGSAALVVFFVPACVLMFGQGDLPNVSFRLISQLLSRVAGAALVLVSFGVAAHDVARGAVGARLRTPPSPS